MEGETLIAMSRRHVRQGLAHIEKQHGIIDRLAESGLPTKEARHLLTQFEEAQADHERHLSQIIEQQRNGERDDDGNLISASGAPLI